MDLLEYAQTLVARGNTSHNAHVVQLQSLVSPETPVKTEIKTKANKQIPVKSSNNTYLLIGGLFLLLGSFLALGYWLGRKKNQPNLN